MIQELAGTYKWMNIGLIPLVNRYRFVARLLDGSEVECMVDGDRTMVIPCIFSVHGMNINLLNIRDWREV